MSLKRYNKVKAYILDDNDKEDPATVRRARAHLLPVHNQKNDLVRGLLTDLFDCEVHPVKFAITDKPEQVYDFFRNEVNSTNGGDLMIIYFDGEAGLEGDDYSWHFGGFPKKDVNAVTIMSVINQTDVDCLFLLDCGIPTRFLSERERLHANTEIVSAGHQLQTTKGVSHPGGAGDFTMNLINDLYEYAQKMIDLPMSKVEKRAPQSVPEIMRWNKRLTSNPLRVRFKEWRKETIKRIVFNPVDIKATGKLRPFAKTIRCPKHSKIDESLEDEGISILEAEVSDEDNNGEASDKDKDDEVSGTAERSLPSGLLSPEPESIFV
ncbi:hypothetical protein K431DRAFT_315002 [Polychaeton citri CBS 116435]|uniref:Uncharacterized protein n=1 Tax=Polychaeton citri CBS 116435 TaxID=1314669 RepID=A0A9P4Q4K2_9PEZI|nr:hypothetical protein K431DRAFT_315002 [Polychaeton citri CBS 116435]